FNEVTGYTLDINHTLDFPFDGEYCNLFFGDIANPWPGRTKWDRTFFSPLGQPTGTFKAWANNWVAADRSDNPKLKVRNNGIVGVIDTKGGWSMALSRQGNAEYLQSTCNVWMDQHNQVKNLGPDADGKYRIKFRLVYLPPEATEYINDNTDMMFKGDTAVMPRLGQLDDFEDQPLPLTSPVRGLREDNISISEVRAHSGKKSIVVNGDKEEKSRGLFSIAPQIILDAKATYRLTAWVYVESENTTASITADLYRANVHWDDRLRKLETNVVKTSDKWQKLTLELSTNDVGYDPFTDLRFRVIGPGKAYFDDFCYVKIN
ncbi:MAG: carbohydrate binding domain-containing protein, partial [bacterium]